MYKKYTMCFIVEYTFPYLLTYIPKRYCYFYISSNTNLFKLVICLIEINK